jgi:hypothetical protein
MLEKTKQEAISRGKDSSQYIEQAISDTKMELANLGIEPQEDKETNSIEPKAETKTDNDKKPRTKKKMNIIDTIEAEIAANDLASVKNLQANGKAEQYDIISLPSEGECYNPKVSKLPVGYLTAYDENMITSPNLYRDGLVIDLLLRNKVLSENFDVDNLCSGDADAITLFLRATSYGPEFPVTVSDPETHKTFDAVIDLSKIKYKPFKLKGDENGLFEYTLPLSKDKIKFRFLTRKQNRQLDLLSKYDESANLLTLIDRSVRELSEAIEKDSEISGKEKSDLMDAVKKINDWGDKVSDRTDEPFSRALTNKMEMHIMSVNGNTDRDFIHEYVNGMRAKDAMSLRTYISDNEPGLDFNVEVERPEEFGGGSFKTFLEWDDTVFLNLA